MYGWPDDGLMTETSSQKVNKILLFLTETNKFVIVFQLRVFACRKCTNRFHFWGFLLLWRFDLFSDLALPDICPSTFSVPDAIQFRICSKSAASHQKTSSHLPLGLPTDLLTPQHLPNTFSGIRESSILAMWPDHWSLYFRFSMTLWGVYL